MQKVALTTTSMFGFRMVICIGKISLIVATSFGFSSYAEKADRTKPIEIEAASAKSELATNVQTLEGAVVLTQGTMRITADRMILKRDAQNNIFAELSGLSTSQILFREKREGFEDFMEGAADRAEFDQAANTVKLFNRAQLKNGNDVLSGDYIFYNSLTEVMLADGRAPGGKIGKDGKAIPIADTAGRVRIVIQPRVDKPATAQSQTSK